MHSPVTLEFSELDILRAKIEAALLCVHEMAQRGKVEEHGVILARRSFALAAIANARDSVVELMGRAKTPDEDGAA